MAVIASSNQYTLQMSVRRSGDFPKFFEGIIPVANVGTITCLRLPPGRIRIFPYESRWQSANMVANATVSVGYDAYTDANGAAVAANAVALLANTASGAGAVNTALAAPANGGLLIDSQSGVTITATVATANTVANQTFSGYIDWVGLGSSS